MRDARTDIVDGQIVGGVCVSGAASAQRDEEIALAAAIAGMARGHRVSWPNNRSSGCGKR